MITYLQKNDTLKLNQNTSRLLVGLSWDAEPEAQRKIYSKTLPVDCDLLAALFDKNDKLIETVDYQYKKAQNSLIFVKESQNGAEDGNDEEIIVDLSVLPENVCKIIFSVNLHEAASRKQTLSMVKNPVLRLEDSQCCQELCRFDLSDGAEEKQGVIVFSLERTENGFLISSVLKFLDEAGNRRQLMNGLIHPTLELAL